VAPGVDRVPVKLPFETEKRSAKARCVAKSADAARVQRRRLVVDGVLVAAVAILLSVLLYT